MFFGNKKEYVCKPKVYIASDHAGFEMKAVLGAYLRQELGCEVEDCGAHEFTPGDDYPDFIKIAAQKVSENPENSRAVILGGSGQGEAIVANRFKGVRAVVYYGQPHITQTDAEGTDLNVVVSTRIHNDANVLSLGARFLSAEEAKDVLKEWIMTDFPGEERHAKRIRKIDEVN